jgi:hypothetical protein
VTGFPYCLDFESEGPRNIEFRRPFYLWESLARVQTRAFGEY